MGMLAVKMVRFGRRALGLTFGTTMTTSSVPVALRAASQKVLAAVPKYRQSTGKRPQLHWKQLWQWSQGSAAWRRWSAMPPTRQSLVPQPMSSSIAVRCSTAPPFSHEVGGSVSGGAGLELTRRGPLEQFGSMPGSQHSVRGTVPSSLPDLQKQLFTMKLGSNASRHEYSRHLNTVFISSTSGRRSTATTNKVTRHGRAA